MDTLDQSNEPDFFKALYEVPTVGTDKNDQLYNPKSLLDLAARTAGKDLEPCDIVNCQPPLDEALYKKVLHHAFPESMSPAVFMKALCNDGDIHGQANILIVQKKVKNIKQVGFLLVAQFSKTTNTENIPSEDIKVCIEFAKQNITAVSCTNCTHSHGCVHAYAAVMYRINFANMVQIYPPITETLCSMSRNKLQKLIHKVVSKEPAYLVELFYRSMDELRNEEDNEGQIHDPTISDSSGTETMLQLALEKHFKNREKNLSHYFTGYDWNVSSLLEPSILDKHLEKAAVLHNGHPDTTLALQYLHFVGNLAQTYIDKANSRQYFSNAQNKCAAKLFLHDLMVNGGSVFTHRASIDNIDVEKWKEFLHKCHTEYEALNTSSNILKSSKWVELPRLYPLYKNKIEQVFGLNEDAISHGYMSEVISSLFIPSPPVEYEALITGKETPLESKYNEPISIMIARARSYDFASPDEKDKENVLKENLRLIDKIILKLAQMGLKYSVLSVFGKLVVIDDTDVLKDKPFLRFIREHSKDIRLQKKVKPRNSSTSSNDPESSPPGSSSIKENSDPNPKSKLTTPVRTSPRKRKSSLVLASTPSNSSPKRRKSPRLGENALTQSNDDGKTVDVSDTKSEHQRLSDTVIDQAGDCKQTPMDFEHVKREVFPQCKVGENETYVSPDGIAPGQNLSKAQLSYSLLYFLIRRALVRKSYKNKYSCDFKTNDETGDVIKGIQFLALELSRYHLTTKRRDLYRKEQSYLSSLEKEIQEMTPSWIFPCEVTRWLYLSAWHHIGLDFYGDTIPAKLGNLVFGSELIEGKPENKSACFGTDNPRDIFLLRMCDFILLDNKDTYTFASRYSGPYAALESRKTLHLPMEDVYHSFVFFYLEQKEKNDVLDKMVEVAEECIRSQVKMFSYGMWKVLDNQDNNACVERENLFLLQLTLNLRDLFPGEFLVEFSDSIEAAFYGLGAQSLDILKDKIGTGSGDWKRYIDSSRMKSFLKSVSMNVAHGKEDSRQFMYFSVVLDILESRLDSSDPEISGFDPAKAELLGLNVAGGYLCSGFMHFAARRLSSKTENAGRELALKALNMVLNHMPKAKADCECRDKIDSLMRMSYFSDSQIVDLIKTVLDMQRCPSQVMFILLDKLKERPDNWQKVIFNRKLSKWLLRNIMIEIRAKLSTGADEKNGKDIFKLIKEKFDVYVKHVLMDETAKHSEFKKMIEGLKGSVKFNRSLTTQINKMLK